MCPAQPGLIRHILARSSLYIPQASLVMQWLVSFEFSGCANSIFICKQFTIRIVILNRDVSQLDHGMISLQKRGAEGFSPSLLEAWGRSHLTVMEDSAYVSPSRVSSLQIYTMKPNEYYLGLRILLGGFPPVLRQSLYADRCQVQIRRFWRVTRITSAIRSYWCVCPSDFIPPIVGNRITFRYVSSRCTAADRTGVITYETRLPSHTWLSATLRSEIVGLYLRGAQQEYSLQGSSIPLVR